VAEHRRGARHGAIATIAVGQDIERLAVRLIREQEMPGHLTAVGLSILEPDHRFVGRPFAIDPHP